MSNNNNNNTGRKLINNFKGTSVFVKVLLVIILIIIIVLIIIWIITLVNNKVKFNQIIQLYYQEKEMQIQLNKRKKHM